MPVVGQSDASTSMAAGAMGPEPTIHTRECDHCPECVWRSSACRSAIEFECSSNWKFHCQRHFRVHQRPLRQCLSVAKSALVNSLRRVAKMTRTDAPSRGTSAEPDVLTMDCNSVSTGAWPKTQHLRQRSAPAQRQDLYRTRRQTLKIQWPRLAIAIASP